MYKVFVAVGLEHLVLVLKVIIAYAMPDVSEEVQEAMERDGALLKGVKGQGRVAMYKLRGAQAKADRERLGPPTSAGQGKNYEPLDKVKTMASLEYKFLKDVDLPDARGLSSAQIRARTASNYGT